MAIAPIKARWPIRQDGTFPQGMKELFLPNFSIALHRTPALSPYHAKFRVPLYFSKLDLRDYLYHAYRVRSISIRSYVKQQRVQSGKPHDVRPAFRRWHRPRAQKFMTVEMERPFVWPEEPDDQELKAWNKDEAEMSDMETKKLQDRLGSMRDAQINDDRRERMREQARALLEGKVRWTPQTAESSGNMMARQR